MGFSNHVQISSSRFVHGQTRVLGGGAEEEDEQIILTSDHNQVRQIPASMLARIAMRVSRAKWFTFLRRVFHYQNGSRSHLGENPFNSCSWMMLELLALLAQICVSMITLFVSKEEKPVWPMRIWIVGYDFGCVMSLFILCWRYRHYHLGQQDDGISFPDLEQQRNNEESRELHLVNKCKHL
ncbi:hypothetical protein RDABS01_033401 [Bienertia sinuspersici]